MRTLAARQANTILKQKIYARELSSVLEQITPDIKIISFDCFDTLLWRKTAESADVFFDLQHAPTFQELDFSAHLRMQAERRARQMRAIQVGTTEVFLEDIYRIAFPRLTLTQENKLVEEELAAEMQACYAFPPVVDFLRAVSARGMRVIIVSDIYFKREQLRRLLAHLLPLDVMQAIEQIYCSSDFGKAKSNGLFEIVLNELAVKPASILHIGDNPTADFAAAGKLGMHALHLVHHDEAVNEILRMRSLAASTLDPSIHHTYALASPFHGVLAAAKLDTSEAESLIGYAALGPLLYAFARYINDRVAAMRAAGKNPKVIFLLRDAYLPFQACRELLGAEMGNCVRISRFAAYAASFRRKQDVEAYLIQFGNSKRFNDIARQLMLPEQLAEFIIQKAKLDKNSLQTFIRMILQDDILQIIFKQSKQYCQRLYRYLENEIALCRGDDLVFIDLGYTGTAQLQLQPVFKEEMNIDIYGLYLIALPVPGWKLARAGLLDASNYDQRALTTLVTYIAMLEQLCTSPDKSVLDYTQEGMPQLAEIGLSEAQYVKLSAIQSECLRFIKEADDFFTKAHLTVSMSALPQAALAELGRMLFFPTQTEINYLRDFNFDVNLGIDATLKMIDIDAGLAGLKRRGMLFMERNLKTMRTNYPAELRAINLDLSLTLLMTNRFGLNINKNDMSLFRQKITASLIRDDESIQVSLDAIPTYEGYFAIVLPVCAGNYQANILFGQHYKWLQIESVDMIVVAALFTNQETENTYNAWNCVSFVEMDDKGKGLFACMTDAATLAFVPQYIDDADRVLRVVFRPI